MLMKRESEKQDLDELNKLPRGLDVLGICLGASTVSLVHVKQGGYEHEKPRIIKHMQQPHEGNPRQTLLKVLSQIEVDSFDKIVATGRRFRQFVNLTSISEPEAVENAYRFVKPDGVSCRAIVSAGGETFMAYVLNRKGQISNVLTGNKCASGTGEFFLQQLRRMNVTLDEAAEWAATEEPHHVSGRCSVFCKSDCTHATNKGVPKSKVTAGLCKMMAEKILELLKKIEKKYIMIVGGAASNRMMIEYLGNEISELIIPDESSYFEALGAAIWALDNDVKEYPGTKNLFKSEAGVFDRLPPLNDFENMVEFKSMKMGTVEPGDICILGLDVGSTTTKAVLTRKSDNAMLGSIYLRTNGDPVGASRACYRSILEQVEKYVDPSQIKIIGLGVTGSGRQIAGLHALTDGIINEIIAHATASVFFDPDVDTIFEIGGQDAKYTYITNGVSSDYAMNEACSAGTGSFLEESALETLGVKMEDIAEIAVKGKNPPNFNDQCAAFIASDIKNAIHEGVEHEDIVAGLVYSICLNYSNRVKGNRPMGEKVFMQGGVCYNRAVPLAMASLTGKPIIVPPEPGLMGAYGVALEVKNRIEKNLLEESVFDLRNLIDRDVAYRKPFICQGGKEKCDRRCEVAVIEIEGKKYPFGGACNRYYNMRHKIRDNAKSLDFVRLRQKLVFEKYGDAPNEEDAKHIKGTVGINKSFIINTYYPLYSTFFTALGFKPVLSHRPSKRGIDLKGAAFCYPGELTHGFFHTLLSSEEHLDYIFMPHFKSVPAQDGHSCSELCPFVQGESFYLKMTFKDKIEQLEKNGTIVLSPYLHLSDGLEKAKKPLLETAYKMGASRKEAITAFEKAVERQKACFNEMKEIGKQTLEEIEADPDRTAVVLFGRPYNAFAEEAHMGIPHKLASRDVHVIPLDFLPIENENSKDHMYWGMGQLIMQASRFVVKHPQLFATFITNFSCGPDSFIIGFFRDIMGQKPSLTLELDSHTADAGLETRIEAFLDIVSAYRQLVYRKEIKSHKNRSASYKPAQAKLVNGVPIVQTSSGDMIPFSDPRVTFMLPSMGRLSTEALSAAFNSVGFNTFPHPPADEAILKIGRANTSCKECLPLILTTGMMLNYIHNIKKDDEILVYFMATASGPCRFGQYFTFMSDLVNKYEITDVALFSLTSENSYAGLGSEFHSIAWWAIVIADVMEDFRSMILANAVDINEAMVVFEDEWRQILSFIEKGDLKKLENQLQKTAERLEGIPMKMPTEEVPKIALVGEIYVRRDSLSRQYITEKLAEKGFAAVCAPIAEWVHYSDYLVDKKLVNYTMSLKEKLEFFLKKRYMKKSENRIKSILSKSGLDRQHPVEINKIIENAVSYVSPNLAGEAILTVGSALTEVASNACGAIAIGPFGCMPNRVSEAILNETMHREAKIATDPGNERLSAVLTNFDDLPFLAIESDGSPFPQLINAKLESFCLRAERLHKSMMANGKAKEDAASKVKKLV